VSNLNNEQSYEDLGQVLDFAFRQHFKKIYTVLPGIVQEYDQSTKRARVLPAIKRLNTDNSLNSLPIVVDVPIIFPSGGGFTVTMPVSKDDAVLILFSQRGISNFKNSFKESSPTRESLLSLQDAIAIPGFGSLNITPSSSTGATIQTEDGNNALIVENGKVEIQKGSNTVTVDDNEMQAVINGNTLTLDSSKMEANVGGGILTLNSVSLTSSVPVLAPSYSGLSGGSANMISGIDMNSQDIDNVGSLTTTLGVDLSNHLHTGDSGGNTGSPKN